MTTAVFRKERPGAPDRFFACEAAGLRWLAVPGGPRVVRVLRVDRSGLDLERVPQGAPTAPVARAFGTALAALHQAGAPHHGSAPQGWAGDGFFGPLSAPLPLLVGNHDRWGPFYAECRLRQVLDLLEGQGRATAVLRDDLTAVIRRLHGGDWDDDERPARLHGDLWSGNLLWTPAEAVLIDPAAHGGHRLTDLAMLELFGAPFLDEIVAAYDEAWSLPPGWRRLLGLHQLYPVGMHAVLFGGPYVGQLGTLAARYARGA